MTSARITAGERLALSVLLALLAHVALYFLLNAVLAIQWPRREAYRGPLYVELEEVPPASPATRSTAAREPAAVPQTGMQVPVERPAPAPSPTVSPQIAGAQVDTSVSARPSQVTPAPAIRSPASRATVSAQSIGPSVAQPSTVAPVEQPPEPYLGDAFSGPAVPAAPSVSPVPFPQTVSSQLGVSPVEEPVTRETAPAAPSVTSPARQTPAPTPERPVASTYSAPIDTGPEPSPVSAQPEVAVAGTSTPQAAGTAGSPGPVVARDVTPARSSSGGSASSPDLTNLDRVFSGGSSGGASGGSSLPQTVGPSPFTASATSPTPTGSEVLPRGLSDALGTRKVLSFARLEVPADVARKYPEFQGQEIRARIVVTAAGRVGRVDLVVGTPFAQIDSQVRKAIELWEIEAAPGAPDMTVEFTIPVTVKR